MNILFIGNSYTYYNDMPKILESLALENGKDVRVDSVTEGGRKLFENLVSGDENNQTIQALASAVSYDVLFLQENSLLPLLDYPSFEAALPELIRLVGAKRTVLYQTWGRKAGSPDLEKNSWTSKEMSELLFSAYQKAALSCNAEISPVGAAFLKISEKHPDTDLYDADLTHPSHVGSCVAATVHYATLFGELPRSFAALGLDENTVNVIVGAVKES